MPRSVFLGRVVKPDEPLWTDEDRAWALAMLEEEAGACPGCGHQRSESMHPDAEGKYDAERMRCHACTPKQMQIRKDMDEDPGLYVSTRRR